MNEDRSFPPPPEFAAAANATPGSTPRLHPTGWGSGPIRPASWSGTRPSRRSWTGPTAIRPLVRRRPAEPGVQLRGPARRGRLWLSRWRSTGWASPATPGPSPTPTCLEQVNKLANALAALGVGRATGSRSTCRWSPRPPWPCSRAPGWERSTRWSSAASAPRRCARGSRTPRPNSSSPPTAASGAAPRVRSSRSWTRRWPRGAHHRNVIVVERTGQEVGWTEGRDHWWADVVDRQSPEHAYAPNDAEDPLFILYTSGTTGKPKGILHTSGGYLTQVAYTFRNVFDIKPDTDVYWCTADVGWVTGTATSSTGRWPTGHPGDVRGHPGHAAQGPTGEIVQEYGVTILYTAPTAIRTMMKWGEGCIEGTTCRRCGCSGRWGEPINPRPGCGTGGWWAGTAARSSTPGGRPRPAPS